jgi:hypothetical protein
MQKWTTSKYRGHKMAHENVVTYTFPHTCSTESVSTFSLASNISNLNNGKLDTGKKTGKGCIKHVDLSKINP